MKKILTIVPVIFMFSLPVVAFAQPQGYPPAGALQASASSSSSSAAPTEEEVFTPKKVPLTKPELHSVQLAKKWARHDIKPFLSGDGRVIFMHGMNIPTVIAAPFQVCDVELEAGEVINDLVIGDNHRWQITSGMVATTPHIFIKARDTGLESSIAITTNRRVYHLRLVSHRSDHIPYVGFTYADQENALAAQNKANQAKKKKWQSTPDGDGQVRDLSALNFAYDVRGKARWKPERVYDDGRQTFLQLPRITKSGEMPVLLVKKDSGNVLVNYRVKDTTMVVDGLFDRIALVVGVGSSQEKVEVRRDN